ncbi:hypothetical protein CDAR_315641 [Caerostris darwini]|uniref:Uncharacterized protein n=1 Tax=Caerostris darwini TaxID=1538125 RepID=A0AAV4TUE5_9ARAC|nr:hypothetical protein CDAR_315641 [Caerostris darwini]
MKNYETEEAFSGLDDVRQKFKMAISSIAESAMGNNNNKRKTPSASNLPKTSMYKVIKELKNYKAFGIHGTRAELLVRTGSKVAEHHSECLSNVEMQKID